MQISTKQLAESAHLVSVRGPVDPTDAEALETVLSELLGDGRVEVVADLSGVDSVDAGLVTVVARCAKRYDGAGSRLLLAGRSFVGRVSKWPQPPEETASG